MPRVKVIYNRTGCIGAGACQLLAPKFWKMAKDNKADLSNAELNPETGNYELEIELTEKELRVLQESADSCPVEVIKIVEEK